MPSTARCPSAVNASTYRPRGPSTSINWPCTSLWTVKLGKRKHANNLGASLRTPKSKATRLNSDEHDKKSAVTPAITDAKKQHTQNRRKIVPMKTHATANRKHVKNAVLEIPSEGTARRTKRKRIRQMHKHNISISEAQKDMLRRNRSSSRVVICPHNAKTVKLIRNTWGTRGGWQTPINARSQITKWPKRHDVSARPRPRRPRMSPHSTPAARHGLPGIKAQLMLFTPNSSHTQRLGA